MDNLISAYFAIRFPSFTYYVATLSCTIGRRSTPVDAVSVHVDIDLGPLKSVSRLHARIEYDEDAESFVICILGRNGAWIDGVWAKSGAKVPLASSHLVNRTNIQIASRTFQFVLADGRAQSTSPVLTRQSPSPSVIDVIDFEPANSPQPTAQELMPREPLISLPALCSSAIKALGGKATLSQIRRWLSQEHEWYRLNTGWQASIRTILASNPEFLKVRKERGYKGRDSLYTLRALIPQNPGPSRPKASKALPAAPLVDPEADLVDVDGLDDVTSPPSGSKLSTFPAKSKLEGAKKLVEHPVQPSPVKSETSNLSAAMAAEERRNSKRRAHLDVKINAAISLHSAVDSGSSASRSGCIPIRIGAIEASATTQQEPLALVAGEIVLSPKVFSHISAAQLTALRKLNMPVVLQILQEELKQSLKQSLIDRKKRAAERLKIVSPAAIAPPLATPAKPPPAT